MKDAKNSTERKAMARTQYEKAKKIHGKTSHTTGEQAIEKKMRTKQMLSR